MPGTDPYYHENQKEVQRTGWYQIEEDCSLGREDEGFYGLILQHPICTGCKDVVQGPVHY